MHGYELAPFGIFSPRTLLRQQWRKQSSCGCKNWSPGWLKKVLMFLTLPPGNERKEAGSAQFLWGATCTMGLCQKNKEDSLPSHVIFITTPHWLCFLAWLVSKAACCKTSHATWPVNQKCHWLMGQWAHAVCCKLNLGLSSFSIAIVSYVCVLKEWSCEPWSSCQLGRSGRGCW